MVKIVLLKPMVVCGHPQARVGDVLEVTPNTYQVLEAYQGARLASAADVPTSSPGVIETREPVAENRDPAPETPPTTPAPRRRAR